MFIDTSIDRKDTRVTPQMLAAKFRSKNELHNFLAVEC